MEQTTPRPEACHNCRRQRLQCDRSLPQCLKCIKRGQECLGYQRLLRWEQGVASRGKMAGMTFDDLMRTQGTHETGRPSQQSSGENSIVPLPRTLTNPMIQDLDHASQKYLFYFTSDVCKDLVLYDSPKHNPFRDLIFLAHKNPILLHIIIANSALHMSNATQKFLIKDSTASPTGNRTSLLGSPCLDLSMIERPISYNDALAAKQRALALLQSALSSISSLDIDVALAVVLLFVEFELIDSGRNNWRHHVNGAKTIIRTLCGPEISTPTAMTPLRSCLISNCLVFDILGSTLANPMDPISSEPFSTGTLSLLQDAEGNHCSSFPAVLLQLIQTGAQLFQPSPISHMSSITKKQRLLVLLNTAQSFNPITWAKDLQPRSPTADLIHRTHVAFAHRAAVCIYLSRVFLSLYPTVQLSEDLESLVADMITHLSIIRPDDALFTATTWPAFIAGAETNDPSRQDWVATRFRELWEVEPWGLIRGALGVLEKIWIEKKNNAATRGEGSRLRGEGDWIRDLRDKGVDWLII